MVTIKTFPSRKEWLEARGDRIGGSEAAAIVGMNPYMSNVDLWEIKTRQKEAADISDNPLVVYGANAERHLRELFKLDFPEYKVEYQENNMMLNDRYPFAHASLDGWLYDKDGRLGILEFKTSTISSAAQSAKWKGRVPDNYYIQLLHYLIVTEAEYSVLVAQLKYDYGEKYKITKYYKMERSEAQNDILYLTAAESDFWKYVQKGKCPPLALPEI